MGYIVLSTIDFKKVIEYGPVKCPTCRNTTFEIKENEPIDSLYKVYFIQCARCGAVVGVQEYDHIGDMIRRIYDHLGIKQ